MPGVKISALPTMTAPDGDDPAPVVDNSASTTKKMTLTLLKEWLQALTSWITNSMVADGFVVQSVGFGYSATSTGSTVMPSDDTIPQQTEGDEYMSLSITPKSATNILEIDISASFARGASGNLPAAIFRDSTADAIYATSLRQETGDHLQQLRLLKRVVAGSTSTTTFKLRAGPTSGSIRFNGAAGTRLFGAIDKSTIVIREIKAS
jgi:hypothetical protein